MQTLTTQNHTQNISVNVGYNFSSGGSGWMGNAAFGKGKGSREEVQHKNSHIVGTNTIHTNSGKNTTLAGAVVSGNRVEMGVGGDLEVPLGFFLQRCKSVKMCICKKGRRS
nr:hemagglutinin repeat-containing protein [Bartonella queenslandensis]